MCCGFRGSRLKQIVFLQRPEHTPVSVHVEPPTPEHVSLKPEIPELARNKEKYNSMIQESHCFLCPVPQSRESTTEHGWLFFVMLPSEAGAPGNCGCIPLGSYPVYKAGRIFFLSLILSST